MYGYAITSPGVTEIDEQLTMAYDLDILKDILYMELLEYPYKIQEEVAEFVQEYVNVDDLADASGSRVGLEVFDDAGEHVFTLRFERVW